MDGGSASPPPQPSTTSGQSEIPIQKIKKRVAEEELVIGPLPLKRRRKLDKFEKQEQADLEQLEQQEARLEKQDDQQRKQRVDRASKYKVKGRFERLAPGETSLQRKQKEYIEQKLAIAQRRQAKQIRYLRELLHECNEKVKQLNNEVDEASVSIEKLIHTFETLTTTS